MLRTTLVLLVLVAAGGCSGSAARDASSSVDSAGKLDPALPPELRAKQAALRDALESIREGNHPSELLICRPGIEFREADDAFFAEGGRLLRWDWAGAPRGDAFPLKLTLQKDCPGVVTVDVERTYRVTRNGQRATISRLSSHTTR